MTQIRWPAEAIWEAVEPTLPGFTVEVLPQIDSTNSELMRRARAGQTDPTLLVAEYQTAGRGRMGRTWLSADGQRNSAGPLTFSLGISLHRQEWSGLSLAVGVCVANALRAAMAADQALGLGLKWPNDLWWQGRKLGGILIETSGQSLPRYAVIGVGINIDAANVSESATITVPPVGLRHVWPQADAQQALMRIVPALVAAVQRFDAEGFSPFQPQYEAVDVLRDRAVYLTDGGENGRGAAAERVEGVARGVNTAGALRVQTASGLVTVCSGEVSVRPIASEVAPLTSLFTAP